MQGVEYNLESKHYVINKSVGKSCELAIKSSGQNDNKISFGLPFIR